MPADFKTTGEWGEIEKFLTILPLPPAIFTTATQSALRKTFLRLYAPLR
jgi:hypothetical protein